MSSRRRTSAASRSSLGWTFVAAHRDIFDANRDWFSYAADGEPIVSNGFYVAQVFSPYRNEGYGFRVVRELLETYDLDGIWENAPGFFHASNRVGARLTGRPTHAVAKRARPRRVSARSMTVRSSAAGSKPRPDSAPHAGKLRPRCLWRLLVLALRSDARARRGVPRAGQELRRGQGVRRGVSGHARRVVGPEQRPGHRDRRSVVGHRDLPDVRHSAGFVRLHALPDSGLVGGGGGDVPRRCQPEGSTHGAVRAVRQPVPLHHGGGGGAQGVARRGPSARRGFLGVHLRRPARRRVPRPAQRGHRRRLLHIDGQQSGVLPGRSIGGRNCGGAQSPQPRPCRQRRSA